MKKLLFILVAFAVCFFSTTDAFAQRNPRLAKFVELARLITEKREASLMEASQNRTKVSEGIYVVTYGNVTVIENDNTQQTIQIKVQKKDDSFYDIFCGNKYVKSVAKSALKEGIKYGITYATGGTLTWLSKTIIDVAVEKAYDAACDYFK